MTDQTRPAAEYVRMSTEDQKYSISNQQSAIAQYAQENGYRIVQTFADPGISGLDLKHRPGLKALLNAVVSGTSAFKTILVLDVSRWGRFQDIDEAAYYEFLCRQSGVRIHYCGEPFTNDYSAYSSLVKTIKRTMAGEYSRELSIKVFRGHSRLASLGFKQGGIAGVGLRRLLVDQERKRKQVLNFGERKSLATDRVILIPGPAAEGRFIRNLFESVADGKTLNSIAKELEGKKRFGRKWTTSGLSHLLRNPKYMGTHSYNKHSMKLKQRQVRNPPALWVTKPMAFEPIVSPELFAKVQQKMANFTCNRSEEDLLHSLKRLWEEKGYLTTREIDASRRIPCIGTYVRRFGSLRAALSMIGFSQRNYPNSKRRLRKELRERCWEALKRNLTDHGVHVKFSEPYWLRVNGVPLIHFVLATEVVRKEHGRRTPNWQVTNTRPASFGRSLIGIVSEQRNEIVEFILMPPLTKRKVHSVRLSLVQVIGMNEGRFNSESGFWDALKQSGFVK